MKICLVGPPTLSEFDPQVATVESVRRFSAQPPLGVLTLAAILGRQGIPVEVVDLNGAYCRYLQSAARRRGRDFCSFATRELVSRSFDVLGFSTICSTYPLTIRIAREVKRSNFKGLLLLGGPQASVVDISTLEAFPFIDLIVRGEADETLPLLLAALSEGRRGDQVPGVTFRCGGKILRNPDAPVVVDLDQLPLPAFHWYPDLGACDTVPLEAGRGCPFGCRFCSTNGFFRRRFRLKSPARVIEQMRAIRDAHGKTRFELIHDNFTADPRRLVEFCEALLASGDRFQWYCGARTDCVDEELLALMARAGCRRIFFGIDAGSARLQRSVGKNLDLGQAASRIASAVRHGIGPTVSLITGFPGETRKDLRSTIRFLMNAARFDETGLQLHLLAPLAGSPIHEEWRDRLQPAAVLSDISCHGWRQDAVDAEIIQTHPDVFPNFYAVPCALERSYLGELREFIHASVQRCRWLVVGLHRDHGNLLDVFDAWRAWLARNRPARLQSDPTRPPYYAGNDFEEDLLEFVRTAYVGRAGNRRAVRVLLEFQCALRVTVPRPPSRRGMPRLARGVRIIRLGADYHAVLDRLRKGAPLSAIPIRRIVIAACDLDGEQLRVSRLSPLSAQLLTLCNGTLRPPEIARRLRLHKAIAGIPRDKVCLFGLATLREQGLIEFG